ncbi:Tyrosine-protein phosphatase non-receptor type 6 [Gamsiella multidivaricata]|nr:Tyrosine-protein phosphatase non-receptor type 6 [Gamsiella multidivaricata]
MVSEQNVHVIVSLTAVSHDRSRRSQKAERYWPAAGETDKFDSDLWVRNVDPIDSHEQVAYRHFEIWNPNDTTTDEKRQVLLVHYQGWPDHGVPSKTNDLRDILYKIRGWKAEQRQSGHKTNLMDFGPIVVHCSAGCGRTGTFCVIDTILSVLEHIQYPYLASPPGGYIPNAIESQTSSQVQEQAQRQEQEQGQGQGQQGEVYDWQSDRDIIYETLTFFRQERMLMVQTAAQYGFCYSTVRDLCQYQ